MKYLDLNSSIFEYLEEKTLFQALDQRYWQDEMAEDYSNLLSILDDKDQVEKLLRKVKVTPFLLELLSLLIFKEKAKDFASRSRMIERLAVEILSNTKYINLIALISFLDGMRIDSIEYMAEALLDQDEREACQYRVGEEKTVDTTALAFLIFTKDPANLHLLRAAEIISSNVFEDYTLTAIENTALDQKEILELIEKGVDYQELGDPYLAKTIKEIEKKHKKDSKYIASFIRKDRLYLLLFREYRQGKLRTLDQAIIAKEAERVILRFDSRLKNYSIIAHDNNKEFAIDLGNRIIAEKLSAELGYIQLKEVFSEEIVIDLLNTLQDDLDDNINLYELCLDQIPFRNNALFILRSEKKEQSLRKVIEEFRDKYKIELLTEKIDAIRWIKIAYKMPEEDIRDYNIIKLAFKKDQADQYILNYSISNMSIKKQKAFNERLRKLRK